MDARPDAADSPSRWDGFPTLAELASEDIKVSEAAWARAYDTLRVEAMLTARRYIRGPRFESDREDAVAAAVQKFQQVIFRGKYDFCKRGISERDGMRYMFGIIAKRRALERCRVVLRLKKRFDQNDDELDEDEMPSSRPPKEPAESWFEAFLENEERERARGLLQAEIAALEPPLPEMYRDRNEGMTYRQIADKHGKPKATVDSHFSRNDKKLIETLRRLV
jgi:DNA-directed RNA polymerase specialized sigma24 family protein